ncbi:MAG: hypothetical protein AVDCRST_MAG19-3976, partial [uncultured Thermomicrobiales bacterium]
WPRGRGARRRSSPAPGASERGRCARWGRSTGAAMPPTRTWPPARWPPGRARQPARAYAARRRG